MFFELCYYTKKLKKLNIKFNLIRYLCWVKYIVIYIQQFVSDIGKIKKPFIYRLKQLKTLKNLLKNALIVKKLLKSLQQTKE